MLGKWKREEGNGEEGNREGRFCWSSSTTIMESSELTPLSSLHEYQSKITKQGSSYRGILIIKRRKEIHQVRLLLRFLFLLFLLSTCLQ